MHLINVYIYIYIYIGGVCEVMIAVVVNGHDNLSSNPGGYLQFT